MDATEVHLDGNSLRRLKEHSFLGKSRLETLHLNNSGIEEIRPNTFHGLTSLRNLYLQNNKITELTGLEFKNLQKLEKLDLSNNRIRSVSPAAFATLPTLKNLVLRGNELTDLIELPIPTNRPLVVDISSNLWSCECGSDAHQTGRFQALTTWLETYQPVVPLHGVQCADVSAPSNRHQSTHEPIMRALAMNSRRCELTYDEAYTLLSNTQPSSSSPILNSNLSQSSHINPTINTSLLWITTVIIILLLAFIIGSVIVYRNWYDIRVCLHSKFGYRTANTCCAAGLDHESDFEDDGKLYDAFLSYSLMDENLVLGELAPRLEFGSPKYKLFLPYRDSLAAENGMFEGKGANEALLQGAQQSRRTIIVCSANFLQNEWQRLEWRSAHQQLFKDPRKTIIFVCLGDVEQRRDLDVEMRFAMKKSPCLKWGEKLFWKKLYFAMPDSTTRSKMQMHNQTLPFNAHLPYSGTIHNTMMPIHTMHAHHPMHGTMLPPGYGHSHANPHWMHPHQIPQQTQALYGMSQHTYASGSGGRVPSGDLYSSSVSDTYGDSQGAIYASPMEVVPSALCAQNNRMFHHSPASSAPVPPPPPHTTIPSSSGSGSTSSSASATRPILPPSNRTNLHMIGTTGRYPITDL